MVCRAYAVQALAGEETVGVYVAAGPVHVARLGERRRHERGGGRVLLREDERALKRAPGPFRVGRVLAHLHMHGHLVGVGAGGAFGAHEKAQSVVAERDSAPALEIFNRHHAAGRHYRLRDFCHDLGRRHWMQQHEAVELCV